MERRKLWLTAPEFAERYQLPYRRVLKLAGSLPGHYCGKQYRFNLARCDELYESGELDRLLG